MPAFVLHLALPFPSGSVSLTIPCDSVLYGQAVFAQALELDPGASRGVSFTDGLALELGE